MAKEEEHDKTQSISTDSSATEPVMSFKKLHQDYPACNCLDHTEEDCASTFMRKSHNAKLQQNDLLTKWELDKAKGITQPTRCQEVRAHKGWSVNVVDQRAQELLEVDTDKFQNHPVYAHRYVHLVQIKRGSALVDIYGGKKNPSHRNVWKSDTFSLDSLITIQTMDLSDV